MQFKKSQLVTLVSAVLFTAAPSWAANNEINVDRTQIQGSTVGYSKQQASNYIVQLKAPTAIEKAQELGELIPNNPLAHNKGNLYNSKSPRLQAYIAHMLQKQEEVAGDIGSINIGYSFKHTYNGFTAQLTAKQKEQLEAHPDVVGVWEDVLQQVTTSNTPEFLGLNGPLGQHALNIKGEDVIIGVVDTGVWPEHPSFADDGSYSDPATLGWTGTCDKGEDEVFDCNNKLIGARYFGDSFASRYEIQTELGEFISPRDADGHGSHTLSTAGGNAGVEATPKGMPAGMMSGIAPRARVAMYKACWNSDYKNEAGEKEAGCFYGDTMAAIEQAVADGVDVINYSIGGSRTNLTIPPTASMLTAAQAGVFVAVSAGNDGPESETVGTPAPWVTSVGASTYDGEIPTAAIQISSRDPQELLIAAEGAITAPISTTGTVNQEVVIAQPLEACFEDDAATALENAAALAGKIALISRGSCAFSEKVERAQLAGAAAVVVYSNKAGGPIVMGGDGAFNIPGFMISQEDGVALNTAIVEGEAVSISLAANHFTMKRVIGNKMADFSSQGPNKSTYDIIKPDITAPGVQILAATTPAPLGEHGGEFYKYLSGTSMSSPHIAGIAALFKESHSSWSPAQIKSAMMTTARQNITEADGITAAGPFNFGAGHVVPVSAMDPGLLFDAGIADYLAFMCGQDEADFVAARGPNCNELAESGFSHDASQLNLPSIAIAELQLTETISRTVSNATNVASVYTAAIEAPEGVSVSVQTFDAAGVETAEDTLSVNASGKASFALTFTVHEDSVHKVWKNGSITWTDAAGHSVRLPIVIKTIPEIKIVVPAVISGDLRRGRYSFPVQMKFSGRTSITTAGLVAPQGSAKTVSQDEDKTFKFNEAGLGFHAFFVSEGTQIARFKLQDSLVNTDGADLDLYVYHCLAYNCNQVGTSLNAGSNEDITLVNPAAAANGANGDFYLAFVHGYDLKGDETTDYTMAVWFADSAQRSTRISSSRRAIKERFNRVSVRTRGLTTDTLYMGGVTFLDDAGVAQGTTILELKAD
ncbi:MAG: S8 family serine peptidase [Gammaproteobacteria bacterium]|nr:S8 family serine peptidase [Gammaproteobacteria bacterium]